MDYSRQIFILSLFFLPLTAVAQTTTVNSEDWITSPGIIGTLVLVFIVVFIAVLIFMARLNSYVKLLKHRQLEKKNLAFNEELLALQEEEIDTILQQRKSGLKYRLKGTELGSDHGAVDEKGLVSRVTNEPENPLFDEKKKHHWASRHPMHSKRSLPIIWGHQCSGWYLGLWWANMWV